jgi:CheY-like chemotaxis protein
VVDDEPSVCAVLVSVLNNLGYETAALPDPHAALARLQTELPKPDVLITDFAMPLMSGLDLIRAAKTLHPLLKTVLASGVQDQPAGANEVTPDAFIEKPFSTKALAGILRSLIGPGQH